MLRLGEPREKIGGDVNFLCYGLGTFIGNLTN